MFWPNLFEFSRLYFAAAERGASSVRKNWKAASCFLNQNNCLILWKWLKIVKKYPNILLKVMRNISLNVNCAAKRSQNLQTSEFKKARENSNSFGRNVKMPKMAFFKKGMWKWILQHLDFLKNPASNVFSVSLGKIQILLRPLLLPILISIWLRLEQVKKLTRRCEKGWSLLTRCLLFRLSLGIQFGHFDEIIFVVENHE